MDRRVDGVSRRTVLFAAGAAVAAAGLAQPMPAGPITRVTAAGPSGSAERAELAERAIVARHVRTLWGHSGWRLGLLVWPATPADQSFLRWCYWWQAHLLDCAIDAAHRHSTPERVARVAALAYGIRTRNVTGWANRYYDDMAWLVLALDRADRLLGVRFDGAVDELLTALDDGWNPEVGAVPWRRGDRYYNTPAVGPTGIAMARLGRVPRAAQLAEFLYTRLHDTGTGLILDGVHEPDGRVQRDIHTYCQGVAIGLNTELAVRTGDPVHHRRASALIEAVAQRLTTDGVIAAADTNDSGLFMGILARYLAEAALVLGNRTAATIVHTSAEAAWRNRAEVDGLPLFGTDWARPVTAPNQPGTFLQLTSSATAGSANLSRDLSVQLSSWILLEADHQLTAADR
ncbi:glycoside hydrolase family 76 protein [Nocardia rhizosphaerae]|uniref:Glycoside hydrolase family 76 protein n=1 Tax=Nocardia rhizosphaerae TaxID=1691571 RepID=A0ABV8L9W8_9NOCA